MRTKQLRLQPDWLGSFCDMSVLACIGLSAFMLSRVGHASDFTDIFYTNSFRGTFEWANKMDFIGMICQWVISVFSVLGVVLIAIRIVTSLLVRSAPGLCQEIHDIKQAGSGDLYDLGLLGMAKSVAQGKHGTGADAIISAAMCLSPDFIRYSDFAENSGMQFDSDITTSQYMLKIAIPTVMAVFFFAMGFNGTLWRALAVTVDGMGAIADKAVSVNYAALVDDLVNSNAGYKFSFGSLGTNLGDYQQDIAKDVYGRAVSRISNPSTAQLQAIGKEVETWVAGFDCSTIAESSQIGADAKTGLLDGDKAVSDRYIKYLGYDLVVNSGGLDLKVPSIDVSELVKGENIKGSSNDRIYIFFKQTNSFDGSYFNTDSTSR